MTSGVASAEGLPKIEWEMPGGAKLRIYGQINQGILVYDDGFGSEAYGPVDNNNSSSRIGVTYTTKVLSWDVEGRIEAEYKPYSSNAISRRNDEPDWEFYKTNMRKFEVSMKNEGFGTLWLGQGSMASDGTAEVDLSGTSVAAYSQVSDSAGGQLMRNDANGAYGPAVRSIFNNYDGLSRKFRVRYDTPKLSGFGVQTSYGRDVLAEDETDYYDVALTYGNKFEDLQVQGAVAYGWQSNDVQTFDGSGSILHVPTGLNFTVAAGSRDIGTRIGSYVYVKGGVVRDLVDWGATAMSVDYYAGQDIASLGRDSHSVGVALVQNIKAYNMELWATYREYRYDDPVVDFANSRAFFAGTRVKF